MKIKITRSNFLDGLKKVQNVIGAKGSLQIIQNVLMEASDNKLQLTTTDLDISIRSTVPCEVEKEGATTLPVKLLVGMISRAAEGVIEIDVDEADRASISAASATFNITGMNVIDYPRLPEDSNSFEYVIDQENLRDMFRKTAYAASQDETRKTLKGVLMSFRDGKLTMVATDGRRLAMIENEVEFPENASKDIVLPVKVVAELQRALGTNGSVRISVENSQISFNLGDTRIYSKVLDDVYPNYRQVIPAECAESVKVDRQLLLSAIDRVSVMSFGESNSITLSFLSNELIVKSSPDSGNKGRDSVPIKYEGPSIDIAFNPDFLMDPLKAIDDDEVSINFNNNGSPAMMKCSKPFLYVMMPLRT